VAYNTGMFSNFRISCFVYKIHRIVFGPKNGKLIATGELNLPEIKKKSVIQDKKNVKVHSIKNQNLNFQVN